MTYSFHEYDGNVLAAAAITDLRVAGLAAVGVENLFRGKSPGALRGPFVSQFLWRDIPYGQKTVASLLAQKVSYYQKWQIHRRARPESFGGRIDVHLSGRKSYDIHPAVLHSEALARTKAATGSYLLPAAYAEGSGLRDPAGRRSIVRWRQTRTLARPGTAHHRR